MIERNLREMKRCYGRDGYGAGYVNSTWRRYTPREEAWDVLGRKRPAWLDRMDHNGHIDDKPIQATPAEIRRAQKLVELAVESIQYTNRRKPTRLRNAIIREMRKAAK